MTTQPARSYTRLAIAIVLAASIIAATIFASSSLGTRTTITETSTSTTTVTTANNTNQTITSTVCSVAAPPPQGIYLRLVSGSGSPIAGYEVTIQYALAASCNPSGAHLYSSVAVTNSSGWILFQGWLYYFVFVYSGGTYNFTVPTDPMAWTVGTISLPSGTLTTRICGLGGGALNSSCQNSATTTVSTTASITSIGYVTGTSVISSSDTYLTACSVTGIGGFQFLIVSDSTGAPVTGETINAVDRLGCDIVGQTAEMQVVYLDSFSVGQGGWLTPVFPNQAEPGGQLSFTVTYQGQTYSFSATVPPIGTSCVTLHVPSGNVTTATVMNGQGSYCWQ
jgi:hypothetical protein